MTPLRTIPPFVDWNINLVRSQAAHDFILQTRGFSALKAHLDEELARAASENREHVAGEGWVR